MPDWVDMLERRLVRDVVAAGVFLYAFRDEPLRGAEGLERARTVARVAYRLADAFMLARTGVQ